jgi:hypothetical protein
MYDRENFVEDEEALEDIELMWEEHEYDSEKELDFGDAQFSEPREGLYEGLESELPDHEDDDCAIDPYIEDLVAVDEDDVTTQTRVDFDFTNFYTPEGYDEYE